MDRLLIKSSFKNDRLLKKALFAQPNSRIEQIKFIVNMRTKSALLLKVRILAIDDLLRPARVSEKPGSANIKTQGFA